MCIGFLGLIEFGMRWKKRLKLKFNFLEVQVIFYFENEN